MVFPYHKGILIYEVKGFSIIFLDILFAIQFEGLRIITSGIRALSWARNWIYFFVFFLQILKGKNRVVIFRSIFEALCVEFEETSCRFEFILKHTQFKK